MTSNLHKWIRLTVNICAQNNSLFQQLLHVSLKFTCLKYYHFNEMCLRQHVQCSTLHNIKKRTRICHSNIHCLFPTDFSHWSSRKTLAALYTISEFFIQYTIVYKIWLLRRYIHNLFAYETRNTKFTRKNIIKIVQPLCMHVKDCNICHTTTQSNVNIVKSIPTTTKLVSSMLVAYYDAF